MSEDEEEKESTFALTYPYLSDYYERRRKEREKEEAEEQKEIEESVASNEKKKAELLEAIHEKLLDVSLGDIALSEGWFAKIREFIEQACGRPENETIIILLTRDDKTSDIWNLEAIVSPTKGRGKRYIEVDFGDGES